MLDYSVLENAVSGYVHTEAILPLYHSTKSETFLKIFASEPPFLGISYPVYTFYGKPSFFCQFSGKINRMTVALDPRLSDASFYCLHDSEIQFWTLEFQHIFHSVVGSSPLVMNGDVNDAAKAAALIFGSNVNYYLGTPLSSGDNSDVTEKYLSLIKAASAIDSPQSEKIKTFEIKISPCEMRRDAVVLFVVLPPEPRPGDTALEVDLPERDAARALYEAATVAFQKGYKVFSDLSQSPRPTLSSIHHQLFNLVKSASSF